MNFTIGNFFTGLILVGIGTLTLVFNFQIVNTFGRQDWIERRLGGGTTFLFFKVISVLVVFVGLLFATGLGGSFFTWLLSPIAHILNPKS